MRTDDRRDLVFLSYSRDDAQWAQRFAVMLKPMLRDRRLALWIDADLRAGDAWQAEIMRGITQSRVALLLVSADFLASDFIMEQELPALQRHGVRLTPVLVGECQWKREKRLTAVQWLHDPGRDGALNLVEDRNGLRDKAINEICDELLLVAPPAAEPAVIAPDASAPLVVTAEVPPGAVRGELFAVPALPPGYVVRDELAGLIDAVVAGGSGAVGVTGEVSALGVHGQGGIGKSVLAAAVARDEDVRHRFPDGLWWVTVGEHPDVLALQLELLDRLGGAPPGDIDATARLRDVLSRRRVLLVVDDVWSAEAAAAFRVTGPQGRVVFTTRDPEVTIRAGARAHRVDVLSPAAARGLAVSVVGGQAQDLPAVVDRMFGLVGRVPLAVALLAATVRGGRAWDEVAADLERDGEVFAGHPYANTFKAMQIAVAALPDDLSTALFGLAVFPPDIQVPVAAVSRLWAHTRDTAADLDRLAAAGLLQRDGATIGFHDLQHDYLLLHAPRLADLHTALLNAYRVLLGEDGGWWELPVGEPYVWDHVIAHLRGAGRHEELSITATDPAFLARRMVMGGVHAAEADLGRAAAALPADDAIGWWRDWIPRHAHLLAAGNLPADAVPIMVATLYAWLSADASGREHGIDPERVTPLLPTPHLRVRWGLTPPSATLLRSFTGHTAAWSPDGSRLAVVDSGGVTVWDSASGEQRGTVIEAKDVGAVAWSPDGSRLALGSVRGVQIWDPAAGEQRYELPGPAGSAKLVAWAPDGSRLVFGGYRNLRSWNPVTGEHWGFEPSVEYAQSMALSPDGAWLVVSDFERVWLYDAMGGERRGALNRRFGARSAWSPDSALVATGNGYGNPIRVWDPAVDFSRWRRLLEYRPLSFFGMESPLAWSPDGSRLALGDYAGAVSVVDAATGEQRGTIYGQAGGVSELAWSPDGTRLATTHRSVDTVRVWNPVAAEERDVIDHAIGRVHAVAWSADGTRLATSHFDGGPVRLWDPATGAERGVLAGRDGIVTAMAWSPDGCRLVAAGGNGRTRLWEVVTGEDLGALFGQADLTSKLSWSPDGTRLAALSRSGVRLWAPATDFSRRRGLFRRRALVLQTSEDAQGLAWSPDGSRLVTVDMTQMVLWDPSTGEQQRSISMSGTPLLVEWSPDGSRLALGGYDGRVELWDPVTGERQETIVLPGRRGLSALAWSPDGIALATGRADGHVVVHDLANGDRTAQLRFDEVIDLQWTRGGLAVAKSTGVTVLDLVRDSTG